MGYTRVVQYGDVTETYEYEKLVTDRRGRPKKKPRRSRTIRKYRSQRACKRAKFQFFRLVSENLASKGLPSFVTLTMGTDDTDLSCGYSYILTFKRNVKNKMGITFSYIAVPEWQKKGRLHFHLLVWGLQSVTEDSERDYRNLQRCYQRGYLDFRHARENSPKLASYLAKYMAKAYEDERLSGRRAYSCSRDIDKIRSYGSNSLSLYTDHIVDVDNSTIVRELVYNVPYLGRCKLTRRIKQKSI